MRQLTGLEQVFLKLEGPTTSAVIGCLVRFDAPQPGQPVPDEPFMRMRLHERIPHIPPFRQRVVSVPLGLDHAYLAESDRVDVERHLRTITLAAPGDERALSAEISRIMSTDLAPDDPDGPRWDYTIIDGLADGGLAHLMRAHHALADGSTMLRIWDALADEPQSPLPDNVETRTLPQPLFGSTEMAARAALGLAKKTYQVVKFEYDVVKWAASRYETEGLSALPGFVSSMLPGTAGRELTALFNRRLRARGAPELTQYTKTYGNGPDSPINGRASSKRTVAYDEVAFDEVKSLSRLAGTTINNIVVTVAAGALRRFLTDLDPTGSAPTEPIVVSIPVSLWGDHVDHPWGNHVHMILADLPVHLADPLERLTHVTEALIAARASLDNTPAHLVNDFSSIIPPDFYGLVVKIWTRLPDKLSRPAWNVVVSNVRGPKKPDSLNGMRIRSYFPISFLSIGGGINISLQSYVDRFCFGIVGAPDKTGDLWPLVGHLREALEELRTALEARG